MFEINFSNQKYLYNVITDKHCLENNSKQSYLPLNGIKVQTHNGNDWRRMYMTNERIKTKVRKERRENILNNEIQFSKIYLCVYYTCKNKEVYFLYVCLSIYMFLLETSNLGIFKPFRRSGVTLYDNSLSCD